MAPGPCRAAAGVWRAASAREGPEDGPPFTFPLVPARAFLAGAPGRTTMTGLA